MDHVSKRLDEFRKTKRESHPFLAYAPIGSPRPDSEEQAVDMKGVVVVPFREYGRTALWMFDSEVARDAFVSVYGDATLIPPPGFLG